MDWCEENYLVSQFIAEFWNTLSNLIIVGLAIQGFLVAKRGRLGGGHLVAQLVFASIGLGSWMFHMTLSYEYQLLDELPMLYLTLVMFYNLSWDLISRIWLIPLLISYGFLVTLAYLGLKEPLFFLSLFAAQSLLVLLLSYYRYSQLSDRADLAALVYAGFKTYLLASLLWVVDNEFCAELRSWRRLGGVFLQFHAGWHCFSGYACYCFLLASMFWRRKLQQLEDAPKHGLISVHWYGGIIPLLTCTHHDNDNDHHSNHHSVNKND